MSIKATIKKIPGVKQVNNILKGGDFQRDESFFYKHYAKGENTKEQLDSLLLMELHKLEKGFSATNMRPFGEKKIGEITRIAEKLEKNGWSDCFSYTLALSALKEFIVLFEKNGWCDFPQYKKAKSFMADRQPKATLDYGAQKICIDECAAISADEFERFIDSRHSTREYSDKPVTDNELRRAVSIAQKAPSACNRQMCKVYIAKKAGSKKALSDVLPGLNLFEMDNTNLAVITFDMAFASFAGERNQGWLNAGLFAMNFANALHAERIGSCFLQWGETNKKEKEIKKKLGIPESERIAVCIAYGHYKKESHVLKSARRPIDDALKYI